jgi:biopolymer transport protein ExbB
MSSPKTSTIKSKLVAVPMFMLAVFCTTLSLGSSSVAQVSESELNSLDRAAAMDRAGANSNAATPKTGIDFFTLLKKGGVFMIPIGVVSLLVVTIVFDRLIGLRRGKIVPVRLVKDLSQLSRRGDLNPKEVFSICGESSSSLSKVVRTMVTRAGRPLPEIQSAVQEATQREVDRAYGNVRWLNLAAGIAPLLGLLGTVWGLIRAFHDTTQLTAGQNRADFLAVGIYEALVTTLAGLIVAIPAAVASHYFEGKVTRLFGTLEELTSSLLPKLEHLEGVTRFEPIGRELASRSISIQQPSTIKVQAPPIAPAAPSMSASPVMSTARPPARTDVRPKTTKP